MSTIIRRIEEDWIYLDLYHIIWSLVHHQQKEKERIHLIHRPRRITIIFINELTRLWPGGFLQFWSENPLWELLLHIIMIFLYLYSYQQSAPNYPLSLTDVQRPLMRNIFPRQRLLTSNICTSTRHTNIKHLMSAFHHCLAFKNPIESFYQLHPFT